MYGPPICSIENAATCLLVDRLLELRTALTTYSDLMRILKVWSQSRFMDMKIEKALQQTPIDVDRINDYARQNTSLGLARWRLETVLRSMHVSRVQVDREDLNYHRHAKHIQSFPTIFGTYCVVQLVPHAFAEGCRKRIGTERALDAAAIFPAFSWAWNKPSAACNDTH